MGFWDVFDYAVKKTIDGAVQISTVTKSVLTSSYAFGSSAVSKIDESVRSDGVKQKVQEYLPGPESREKIFQTFNHPATKEALKLVPGGGALAAYNIAKSVLLEKNQNPNPNKNQNDVDEQNKYEHVIKQLKVLQADNEKMQNKYEHVIKQLKVLQADNEKMQNKYEHVIQQLKVLQAEIEKTQKQINKQQVMTSNNSSSSTVSEQKPEEVTTGVVVPSAIRSKI